jgi:murein DD-endopeptidase MepM/ murein hydrolase activator NlpD
MRFRIILVALCALLGGTSLAIAAEERPVPREGAEHTVPLYGELLRVYDAPPDPFAPGHRGVDVGAPEGSSVRASAPGVVSFAGSVAGNLSVTIDHGGGLVTSYSFLGTTQVSRGTAVEQGEVIGTVGRGHTGSGLPTHVHLSSRRDGFYFDPLELYVGSGYSDLLSLTG